MSNPYLPPGVTDRMIDGQAHDPRTCEEGNNGDKCADCLEALAPRLD